MDTTELTVQLSSANAIEIFTGERLDEFLKRIEDDAERFVADVETAEGRKQIASKSFSIAKQKVEIDKIGKELVADWKNKARLVDASRKKSRDFLDELKNKVREPLTLWEIKEKERIAKEENEKMILEAHINALNENKFFEMQKELEAKERELQRIEMERIEKEEAEKAERERIENIRKIELEAKERAEKEARKKIEAERKLRIEAELKAKKEKEELEQKRLIEIKAETQARINAVSQAERAKQEAIKFERETAKAKEDEKIRLQKLEQEKAERKARNILHQKKINNEALKGFIEVGLDEVIAKKIILAIANNKIKNVTINY